MPDYGTDYNMNLEQNNNLQCVENNERETS